ncbi:hypothetical protein HAALTHF_47030n [Vreelandella aquamarina]|nr:hypothetical protein HAALTHF_47030n [Halomonas axialensis]
MRKLSARARLLAKPRVTSLPIGRGYKREARSGSNQVQPDSAHTLSVSIVAPPALQAKQERNQSAALLLCRGRWVLSIRIRRDETDFRLFTNTMGHAGGIVRHPDGLIESAHDPRSNGGAASV